MQRTTGVRIMGKVLLFQKRARREVITSQEKYTALINTVFDRDKYWSHWCKDEKGMKGLVGSNNNQCEFCGKTRQVIENED